MEFEKKEGPGEGSGFAETAFDSVQHNLPGIPSGEANFAEWQVPCKVLTDYLRTLGVHQPGEVARRLIDEFGSLSGLLEASRLRLRWTACARLADIIDASL